jgi:hypothetical protein
MNLQDFLNSGLLELYVADQCTPAERAEVERMAALHPELKAELNAIEAAIEKMAMAQAIAPPPDLRDQILESVGKEAHLSAPSPRTGHTGASGTLRFFQIGFFALALATATLGFFNRQTQKENEKIRQDIAQLSQQLKDCNQKQEGNKPIFATLRDPDTKRIRIGDEKAYTYVFHNPARRETLLDLAGVQSPAPGKYLQVWAIVGGQAVSMGMVEWQASNGLQQVPFIEKAEAFALSQEDNPNGNPTPTVVLMVGKV